MMRLLMAVAMASMIVGCSKKDPKSTKKEKTGKLAKEAIGTWKIDQEKLLAELKADSPNKQEMAMMEGVIQMYAPYRFTVTDSHVEFTQDYSGLTKKEREKAEAFAQMMNGMKENAEKDSWKYDVLEDGKDSLKVKLHVKKRSYRVSQKQGEPAKEETKETVEPTVLTIKINGDTMTVEPEKKEKAGGPSVVTFKRVK